MDGRWLSPILRASALYDWLAFALLLVLPDWLLRLFAHPVPANPFLFRMAALPLLLLPVVYLFAARHAPGCPPLVRLSVLLRVGGALAIAALVLIHRPDGEGAYWFFVVGDLVWAALYLVAARRTARA
jgi:hypothetical protein